ncbi:MAG: hypothetical protein ABJG15_06535 [Hyphomonadaceae bacterium]
MLKTSYFAVTAMMFLSGAATAQESDQSTQERVAETSDQILIDDPEPVATEYFLAEGAANADIVTDEELEMEADALAALTDDLEGDMAAMSEMIEE